ncbi:MAG: hypothetical protein ACR2MN_07580, partial [Acidimicrobiales bacterium]
MAERGPRPAFDTPAAGSSPVPAQYGSLGGGLPRQRGDGPERIARERRPFRWKVWRDEVDDDDGLTSEARLVDDGPASEARPADDGPAAGGGV